MNVASKLSLFQAELKRRKVYRVAVVYVVEGSHHRAPRRPFTEMGRLP